MSAHDVPDLACGDAPDSFDSPAACLSRVFLGRDSFACGGTPGHAGKHGYRLPWVTIEWDGRAERAAIAAQEPKTARADEFARVKVRLSALVASLDETVNRGGADAGEFDRGAAHASAVTARQIREILNDTALGTTPKPGPCPGCESLRRQHAETCGEVGMLAGILTGIRDGDHPYGSYARDKARLALDRLHGASPKLRGAPDSFDSPDGRTYSGPVSGATPVTVNVAGAEVTVELREDWSTLAPVTTAARWLAGCGALPFDNFEVRDDSGRLLDPHAKLGDWLTGRTLYVNRLVGIGA